jgi:elongation factor 4
MGAMQGVLLMVDATAGVQAQTVAHYLRARGRTVVPVINKVDLPQADVGMVMEQLEEQLGLDVFNMPVLAISAKTGLNVESILPAIIERIPPPEAVVEGKFEANLIDCWFREFRGVVCMIIVKRGAIKPGDSVKSAANGRVFVVDEVRILQPELVRTDYLHAGQVGYIRCGMKSTHDALIGDTFYDPTETIDTTAITIPTKARPIVFAGMFPAVREEYDQVSIAVDKLLLNDSSVSAERIVSVALGPGWRLGFLGSLHMDVFAQRLEQEFDVNVILTSPNVSYEAIFKDKSLRAISSAEEYPNTNELLNVRVFREPFVKATLIFPVSNIGSISQLCSESRCGETTIEYLSTDRVLMTADLPLVEIIGDFNDRLLSISAGYASLDYEPAGMRSVELVKIGVRLNGDLVDILSTVQPRSRAEPVGRGWVKKLATLLPRQQFPIAVQAIIGTKVIAREDISAVRKDVIAKCVRSKSMVLMCSMVATSRER